MAGSKAGQWLGGGIFLLVGLGVMGGGLFAYVHMRNFADRAIRVPGEVVALSSHTDSDGDTLYSPVFEFQDQDGGLRQVTSSSSSKPAAFDVGEKVEVLYEPGDPTDAVIDSFSQMWLLPTVLIPFGAIFALIGAAVSGLFGLIFRLGRGGAAGPEPTPRMPSDAAPAPEPPSENPYARTDAPVKPVDESKRGEFGSGAKYE